LRERVGTMPDLLIRAAGHDDVDALVTLASDAFRATYGDGHNSWDIEDYVAGAFTAQTFAALLADPLSDLLVALDADGYAGYAHVVRSPAPPCVTGERPIELRRLYLRQDTIGRGYGAALMRRVYAVARDHGCATLWLGVYDQNHHARAFYARFGLVDVGRKDFWFGGQAYSDPVMAAAIAAPHGADS